MNFVRYPIYGRILNTVTGFGSAGYLVHPNLFQVRGLPMVCTARRLSNSQFFWGYTVKKTNSILYYWCVLETSLMVMNYLFQLRFDWVIVHRLFSFCELINIVPLILNHFWSRWFSQVQTNALKRSYNDEYILSMRNP